MKSDDKNNKTESNKVYWQDPFSKITEADRTRIMSQLERLEGWQEAISNKLIAVNNIILFLFEYPDHIVSIEALLKWVNADDKNKDKAFLNFLLSFGEDEMSYNAITSIIGRRGLNELILLNMPGNTQKHVSAGFRITYDETYFKKSVNSEFIEKILKYLYSEFDENYGPPSYEDIWPKLHMKLQKLSKIGSPTIEEFYKLDR